MSPEEDGREPSRWVDRLLIGGAMAYTFFKAMGKPVGKSLVEDDKLDSARDVMSRAKERGLQLLLPLDHVVAPKLEAGVPSETLSVDDTAIGERMGLDIGPKTVAACATPGPPFFFKARPVLKSDDNSS